MPSSPGQISYQYSPISTSGSTPTYLASLAANKAQYANVLAGYQNQLAAYNNATAGVIAGYNSAIANQEGVGQAQQVALNQNTQRAAANTQQQMISSGLGNGYLLGQAGQQNQYNMANAQIGLNDSLQQRIIGLQNAKLGYQAQAQAGASGILGQQNQFMGQAGSVSQSQSGGMGYTYQPGSQVIESGQQAGFGSGNAGGFAIAPMGSSGTTGGFQVGGGGYSGLAAASPVSAAGYGAADPSGVGLLGGYGGGEDYGEEDTGGSSYA
jgi:hypothetical protein